MSPLTALAPLALALALAPLAGAGEFPSYRLQVLGDPADGIAVLPSGVNGSGVSVGGYFHLPTGYFHGVVWDADGQPASLTDTHGLVEAAAVSVLDDGTILGSGALATSVVSHAMRIEPDGTLVLLPSLAGDEGVSSIAFASTSDGFTVGRSALFPIAEWWLVANDAVVWEDGAITSLGTLGGFFAEAQDVNEDRLVIGRSNTAQSDFARGFAWDPVHGMREIAPAEPGGFGHTSRLNDAGTIVGFATLGSASVACVWSDPDGPPSLLSGLPGYTHSTAAAIDDSGHLIVGEVFHSAADGRAVAWIDGAVHDLNERLETRAPFVLAAAIDVDESGGILARSAFDAELGGYVNVLLTPVPPPLVAEPETISLAAGGAQTFVLDAGPSFAAQLYVLLGSVSGTAPGLDLGPVHLPLNLDPYFLHTLTHANEPPLIGTSGLLDRDGRAGASLALPAGSNPALAGLELDHAYVVLDSVDPTQVATASNAVPLSLVP